jgi:hypothetical protein
MQIHKSVVLFAIVTLGHIVQAQNKPKLTLDDFFNSVSFRSVELSPDGNSVVIVTDRANYDDGWRIMEGVPRSGQSIDDALKNAEPIP